MSSSLTCERVGDFREHRRPINPATDGTLSHITRKSYPTLAAAVNAMQGNQIAFRVWQWGFGAGTHFEISIYGKYFLLERAKKSQPWAMRSEVWGTCLADASDNAGVRVEFGGSFKVVSSDEWTRLQTTQHLRFKWKR